MGTIVSTGHITITDVNDGYSVFVASIYITAVLRPATPTGGTYNFTTNVFTPPTLWSKTPTNPDNSVVWVCTYTFSTDTNTSTITAGSWSVPTLYTAKGENALVIITDYDSYNLPCTANKEVLEYTSTGFKVNVMDGTTPLQYDGVGTATGKWKITIASIGITLPTATLSGTGVVLSNATSMTTDVATISVTAIGKNLKGTAFTLSKVITFHKALNGRILSNSLNLLTNSAPLLGNELEGWSLGDFIGAAPALRTSYDPWRPTGFGGLFAMVSQNTNATDYFSIKNNYKIGVIANQKYQATCLISAHRCTGSVILTWYDAAGAVLSASEALKVSTVSNSGILTNWVVYGGYVTPPANTAYGIFSVYGKRSTLASSAYMFIARAYFGEASSDQLTEEHFTSWSEGISVGVSVSIISLYYVHSSSIDSATLPAISGTFSFNFDTLTLTGGTLNGWVTSQPSITTGQYIWIKQATARSTLSTDIVESTEFSQAVCLSGVTAASSATVYLYKKTSNEMLPVKHTTTVTYTFSTKTASGSVDNGWSFERPSIALTEYLWIMQATASSVTNTDTIPATEFSNPVIESVGGYAGGVYNLCHPLYSDFESSVAPPITKSTTVSSAIITSFGAYNGTKALNVISSGLDAYVYLGKSTTDYNITIPAGKKWIVSFYGSMGSNETIRTANNCTLYIRTVAKHYGVFVTLTETITRVYAIIDMTTDVSTQCILRFDNEGHDGSALCIMSIDCIMMEEFRDGVTTPSPYVPPIIRSSDVAGAINFNTVTIDGDKITAGTIASNMFAGNRVTNLYWDGNKYVVPTTAEQETMVIDLTAGSIYIK